MPLLCLKKRKSSSITKLCGERLKSKVSVWLFEINLKLCSSASASELFLSFSEVFCGANGDVLKENETIRFLKLAETYRKIAEVGPGELYEGQLAQDLVADIQAAGSISFNNLIKLINIIFLCTSIFHVEEDLYLQMCPNVHSQCSVFQSVFRWYHHNGGSEGLCASLG